MAEEGQSAQDTSPLSVTVSCCSAITPVTTVTMATTALTATGSIEIVDCTIVPVGWKRSVQAGAVIYISPSNHMLHSEAAVRQYLLTDGTCKCGLECPLVVTRVFNFDPKVPSRCRTVQEATSDGALTKLCNHKRKVIAMSVLQQSGVHGPVTPRGCVVHSSSMSPDSVPTVITPNTATKQGKKRARGRPKTKPQDKMIELQHHQNLSVSQLLALRGADSTRQSMIFNQMSPPYPPIEHMHNVDLYQQQQLQLHLMRIQQQQHMQQQLQLQMQHQHFQHQQGMSGRHPSGSMPPGGMAPPKSPLDCSPPPFSPMHSPTMPPHRSPLSRHGTPSPAHSSNYCKSPAHSDFSSPSPGLITPKEGFFPQGVAFGQHMSEISPEIIGHTPSVIPLASNVLHPSHRGSMPNTQTVCSSHTSPHSHIVSPEHGHSHVLSPKQNRLHDGVNMIHPSHLSVGPIPDPQMRYLPEDVRATLAVSRLAGLPEKQARIEQLAHQEHSKMAQSLEQVSSQKSVQKRTILKQTKNESMPSMEQILGPPDAGAFPASTLLTAAANAQLANQAQQKPTSLQGTNQGPVLSKMGLLMNNNNSSVVSIGGNMGEFNPMLHLSQVGARMPTCAIPNKKTPSRKRKSPASKSNSSATSICELYEECAPENTTQDYVVHCEGSTSPHPAKRKASSSSAKSPIECLENTVQNIETNPNPELSKAVELSPQLHLLQDPNHSELYVPAAVISQQIPLNTAHETKQSEAAGSTTPAKKITTLEQNKVCDDTKRPVTLTMTEKSSSISAQHDSTSTTQINPMLQNQEAVLPLGVPLTEEEKAKQEQEWYLSMIKNTAHFTNMGVDPLIQHLGMGAFTGHGGMLPPNVAQYRQALLGVGTGVGGSGIMQGNPSMQSLIGAATQSDVTASGHGINALAQVAATIDRRHLKRSRVGTLAQAQNALGLQHRIDLLKNPDSIIQGFQTALHQQQDVAILQMLLQQQQQHQQMANFHAQNALHIPPNQTNMPSSMETLAAVAAAQQSANISRTAQQSTNVARTADQQTKRKRSKSKSGRDDPPYKCASRSKSPSRASGVRKVKDILAEARSARQFAESSGQVDAIYQAVVDSASSGVKVMIAPGEIDSNRATEVPSDDSKNLQGQPADSDTIDVNKNLPVPPVVSLSSESGETSSDQVDKCIDGNASNKSGQDCAPISQASTSTCQHIVMPLTSKTPFIVPVQHVVTCQYSSDAIHKAVKGSPKSSVGCYKLIQGGHQLNIVSKSPLSSVSQELKTSNLTVESPCLQLTPISHAPITADHIQNQASGDTQDLVETEHNSGQSTQALDVESKELSPANQTCNSSRQCKPCDESNEVVTSLPSDEESHSHQNFQTGSMELQQELKCLEETEQHSDINIQRIVLLSENADSFTKLVDEPVPAGDEEKRTEQTNLQCNIQTLHTPENKSKEPEQSTQTKDVIAPNKNMKSKQSEQSLSTDDSTQHEDIVVSEIKSSEDNTTFKNSEQSLNKNTKEEVHQNMDQSSLDAVNNANSTNTIVRWQDADVIQVTTTEPEATPKLQKRDDTGHLFESKGLDEADSPNLSSQIPMDDRSDFVTDIPIEGTVPHTAVNTETISISGTVISEATFVSAVAADSVAISSDRNTYLEETSDVVSKSDTNIIELIKETIYDKTNDLSLQTVPALNLVGTKVILDSKTKCNVNQRVESAESVSLSDEQKISGNMLLESGCECDFKEESTTPISKDCETEMVVDVNSQGPRNPQSPSTHVVMSGSILNLPSPSTLMTMTSDHANVQDSGAVQKLSSALQQDVHVSEKVESLTLSIPISDNTCTQDTALEPISTSPSQPDVSDRESLIQAVSVSDNTNTLNSAAEKLLSSPSEQDISEEGTSTLAISVFDNTSKQYTVAEKIPLSPSQQDVSLKESSTQITLVSGNTSKQDNVVEQLPSLVSQKYLCKKEESLPQAISVADNISTQDSIAKQIHLSTLQQYVYEKEESLQMQTNPVKCLQVSAVCNQNFDQENMFSNVIFESAPGLSDQVLLASEIPSQCEMTLAPDELPRDTEGTSRDTASDKTAGYLGLGTENQQVEHYAIQNQESVRLLHEDVITTETAAIHMNNSNSNSASAGACVIQDSETGLSDDILSIDKNSLQMSLEDSESRFVCKPLEINTAEKFIHLSSDTICADFNTASTPKELETVEMVNKSVCSSLVQSNMERENNSGAVQLEVVEYKSASKMADSVEMSPLVSNSVSVAINPQRTQEYLVNVSLHKLEPKSKVEASGCKPTETCLHSDSNDSLCKYIPSKTISDASIDNSKSSENSSICSIDDTAFISSAHQIESCPEDIAAVDAEMGDIATCEPHILDENNIIEKTTNRLEQPLSTNVHDNISGVDFLTKPKVKTTVEITNKHNRSLKLPQINDVMLRNQSILMPAECENDTDALETHLSEEMSTSIVGETILKTACELRTKDTKEYSPMDTKNVSVDTSISFCKTSTPGIGTFGTPVELITSSTVSCIPLVGKVVTEFNLSKHVSDSTQACILRNNVENAIKFAQTVSTEKVSISKPDDVAESTDDKAEALHLNTHVVGNYEINSNIKESFMAVEEKDISSKQGKNQNKPLTLTIKPTEHKFQDSSKIQDATNNFESSREQKQRDSDACVSPTNHNTFTSNLCDRSNPNTSGETNMNNQDTECVISACENRESKENLLHIDELKKDHKMSRSETYQNTPSVQSTISSQVTEVQTMHLAPKEGCVEKATEKKDQTFTLSRSSTEHNNDCEQLAQELSGLNNTPIDDHVQGIEERESNRDLGKKQENLTYNKKIDCESMMSESEVKNMDAESMKEATSPIEEASFNPNDIMVSDQETNVCSLIGSSTKQLSLGKSTEPLLLDTSEFAVKKNYKCEITENGNDLFPEELTSNMQTPGTEGSVSVGSDYYVTRNDASGDGGDYDVANEQSDTYSTLPELKAAPSPESTETATVVNNDEAITDGYLEIPNDIDCSTTSHTVGPTLRSESKENITPDKKDLNEHSRVEEELGKTEIDICHSSHDDVLEEMADNSDIQDKDSHETDDPESPEPIEATATIQRDFDTGDLVWGQIRGYPSWPGKLVSDSDIRGTARRETGRGSKREEGKVWVMWFGDHSYTQVEPGKLKTLSEGLEAHHRARKRNRRGRKMNSGLEAAIQEAMLELDKQTELAGKEGNPVSSKSLCYKPKTKRKRLR